MLAFIATLALALLAGGCAAVATLPISSILTLPSAASLDIRSYTDLRLQEGNFIVIKTNVVGRSKGFALLGILTISPASFTKAMNRLYAQAEIQPGRPQTLASLVMEKDSPYFVLFSLPRTAVRADVIEFVPRAATNSAAIPP